jgi:dTDP-4-dehydrorhamnose 3,5-epimerase
MKINETFIEGLYLIEFNQFLDLRGSLFKPFTEKEFKVIPNINLGFKETWFTKSKLNVVRAMHLQTEPVACEKLVSVVKGEVLDVILDIRKESKTYGQFFSIVLNDKNPKSLYIPKGCAHGYRVLADESIVMYMATEVHSAEYDLGIRWDSFGFDWNIQNPILSEKDLNLPPFIL